MTPENRCLHQIFEDLVVQCPDAVAVVSENEQITYATLNERANRFANYLRSKGAQRETLIGLHLERSVDMVVAVLAVLKVGAGNVLLDTSLPEARLRHLINDSKMALFVTEQASLAKLSSGTSTIFLAEARRIIANESAEMFESGACSEDIAYVVYTSGSTGEPKGVMIPHRSLSRCLYWAREVFGFTPKDRFLLNFFRAPEELFFPLFLGASLTVSPRGAESDTALLVRTIEHYKISVLGMTPSLLNMLLKEPSFKDCKHLKHVYCAGEILTADIQERFFSHSSATLYNAYGLAEAPFTSIWQCRANDRRKILPIGYTKDVTVQILNDEGREVNDQQIGDICIAGPCLALGYLNRPQLTADSFFKDNGRLSYRTGDQAYYDKDGAIVLLGRTDLQVQIRGLRVELGEVEYTLRQHSAVLEAAVLWRDNRLIAYIVTAENKPSQTGELQSFLESSLPCYMLPSSYMTIASMPLTVTGKIDRERLARETEQVDTELGVKTLSDDDKKKILYDWNNTKTDYPSKSCIHTLFEEQVLKSPKTMAVTFGRDSLTYRELNDQSNQLANYLIELGIETGMLVGIYMDRSLEMMFSILAILKAGATYVPVDLKYPKVRIRGIMDDTELRWVLTKSFFEGNLPKDKAQAICIDGVREAIRLQSPENKQLPIPSSALAYVIYTSGSSGKPKGVAIEHRSVVALLTWASATFRKKDMEGVLAATSYCFDLSIFEMFAPLTCGGKVIITESILELTESKLYHPVTLVNTVPSAIIELLNANRIPDTVKVINLAGEALQAEIVDRLYALDSIERVYDLYGPSECTTYSTYALRRAKGPINIGKPISNTQIYILDKAMRPVPLGVRGELWIGGDGLARGYFNQPELTAQKFIANPFARGRIYQTGDFGRYLPDGSIQYLGRLDQQIKLRGYRIELGEIENVILQYPGIKHCAVILRELETEKRGLVAFFEAIAGFDTVGLGEFVEQRLPDYMVPSHFARLGQIPLTANGKIDRNTLNTEADLTFDKVVRHSVDNTKLQDQLLAAWSATLARNTVTIDDNFFDIGGDSLQAIGLTVEIEKQTGTRVPVSTIVQFPTIARLAEHLSTKSDTTKPPSIVALQPSGTKTPLFLVHGLYGDVNAFLALARLLDPERPVYGLQAIGLDGKSPMHTSVDAMTTHYMNEIIARQPNGPYLVGAYSMGGTFAYALAQLLQTTGREVRLLALMDCAPIGVLPLPILIKTRSLFLFKKTFIYFGRWITLPSRDKLTYFKDIKIAYRFWLGSRHADRAKITLPSRSGRDPLEADQIGKYMQTIVATYRFTPYSSPVAVLLSDTHGTWQTAAWKHLVREKLTFHRVPGRHEQIMTAPHVSELAAILNQILDKADAEGHVQPSSSPDLELCNV